jgi:hypothetical protein
VSSKERIPVVVVKGRKVRHFNSMVAFIPWIVARTSTWLRGGGERIREMDGAQWSDPFVKMEIGT